MTKDLRKSATDLADAVIMSGDDQQKAVLGAPAVSPWCTVGAKARPRRQRKPLWGLNYVDPPIQVFPMGQSQDTGASLVGRQQSHFRDR
jgi:hypothetical protein